MRQRKYSVDEIDKMRHAVAQISFYRDGRGTEEELRTYMLNGTDPEELIAAGDAALKKRVEAYQKMNETHRL